jgi:predicted amidohydrolase
MHTEIRRKLAMNDAQILVQPRATGGHPRWLAASILAASTSGAFVVGANRQSSEKDWFAGSSWIYSPEGDLFAETSQPDSFVTIEIDLTGAYNAKSDYPITMFRHYE